MTELNRDEKNLIVAVLKRQLEKFEREGKTITYHEMPQFLAVEEEYDAYLRELIKKLS